MCRVATGWKLRLQPLPLGPGQNPFFSNKPQFSSGVAPKASWGLWGPTHIINGDLLKVHGLKVFVRGTESLSSSPWAGAWLAAGAVASPGGMTCPAQGPRCFERKLGNVRRLWTNTGFLTSPASYKHFPFLYSFWSRGAISCPT